MLKQESCTQPYNLIPKPGAMTGNYMCTWSIQNALARKLGISGINQSEVRDVLDQNTLFGPDNNYHPVRPEDRGDLIFLMDDGWDVPYNTPNDAEHAHFFGAVEPDKDRFSQFGTAPAEILRGISDKVKEMGYAGLGLWISPRHAGKTELDPKAARLYWEERARLCHEADVKYWKVDWGLHQDAAYRRMMSEAARKYAPGLMVEHAIPQAPFTSMHEPGFPDFRRTEARQQMAFSDVYRTYDVTELFGNVCTLQRASEALTARVPRELHALGLINAESQAHIAAALGLTIGIMQYDKEVLACLNWHRLAPPFGIHSSTCLCSDERLEDAMFFETEIDTWYHCASETIRESAPAVIARNCPLPTVQKRGEHAPFVAASKNPITSAYSVAALRRCVDPNPLAAFPADVTLEDVELDTPIGVFGIFGSLTLKFAAPVPQNCRVLAQDLTASEAMDVTDQVCIDGRTMILDGKHLRYWVKSTRGMAEASDPAVMLKLCL